MIEVFFDYLSSLEDFLWIAFGFPTILFLGIYFSFKSNFLQIRKLPYVFNLFARFMTVKEEKQGGVHPLKAFFACLGGCVGIGNVVGICTAIQLGGPGALFWIWMTAIAGMILKYTEVYLGMRFRVPNGKGGFQGGPMYYLQKIFKTSFFPKLSCFLLCLYGIEIFQFSVIIESVTTNFGQDIYLSSAILILLVIFATSGGVRRVGEISSAIIPLFVVLYVGMGLWVLWQNLAAIPEVLQSIFVHAFSPHAAAGGFLGSSMILTASHGIRRGCYTGDVGVGYASVIHSESSVQEPEVQAGLAFLDVFFDTFIICTTSVMIILATGMWNQNIETSILVQTVLGMYFPYMEYFMPFFLFLLGYTTINAYFCVGLNCADFINKKYGRKIYYFFSIILFVLFSFVSPYNAQVMMSFVNLALLLLNGYGMMALRKEISFDLENKSIKNLSASPTDY